MKLVLAPLVFAMGMVACSSQNIDQSSLVAEDGDSGAKAPSHCFSRLAPAGDFDGKSFEAASFIAGSCGDTTGVAVHKIVQRPFVLVRGSDGGADKSKLFVNDQKVYVESDGKKVLIGKFVVTEDGTMLELEDGVEIELKVGTDDGTLATWQFGDWQSHSQEEIHLYL